jgi:vacuolar-type H+-ATPase subunit I/STV1
LCGAEKTVKYLIENDGSEESPMENSPNNLDRMTSRQLSDLRKTLEKARDDKLAELKQVEAELKAVIERLKRVQSAYYEILQREEA